MDEIEETIARLPQLAKGSRKITVEEAEALIATDDDLFSAVAIYTSGNIDIFKEWPQEHRRLLSLLRRIRPFTPWFNVFYRGQLGDCRPSPLGFRSWTANRRVAEYFARSESIQDGIVCTRTGPVRGISMEGISVWRMRLRDESQYPGSQAEWLLLDEKR